MLEFLDKHIDIRQTKTTVVGGLILVAVLAVIGFIFSEGFRGFLSVIFATDMGVPLYSGYLILVVILLIYFISSLDYLEAAREDATKPELESEPELSQREHMVLGALLNANWPDGYADMRVLVTALEMEMEILELAANDLEDKEYVHIGYGADGTFIKIMPEGTRVALALGIVEE